jgi:hypothetical protein
MSVKFHHATHRYDKDWLRWDKKFHAALSSNGNNGVDAESGSKMLVRTANYYAVIRTLPRMNCLEKK